METSGQKPQEAKHWKHLDKNRRKLNIANIQIDAELRQELHEWAEVAVTSVPTLGASRSGHPGHPGHPGQPGQPGHPGSFVIISTYRRQKNVEIFTFQTPKT